MSAVIRLAAAIGITVTASALTSAQPVHAQSAESLINSKCGVCHERQADGTVNRINAARKTPEGWLMTILRMEQNHGLRVTGPERRTLVKHLADTQGLAPSESKGYRYVLERAPGVTDAAPTETLAQMCGRCHTFARVALQRRDEEEWLKLVHFHLGQYPTSEYQALGRDRDWFGIATTDTVKELTKLLPYASDAWTAWKDKPKQSAAGNWRIVGHAPGKGGFHGMVEVKADGDDTYSFTNSMEYEDGSKAVRKGKGIVYAGHEWRSSADSDNGKIRAIMGLSEDGKSATGRSYLADNETVGASMTAVRVDGAAPQVMAIHPGYVRQGATTTVKLHGVGLSFDVDLGAGLKTKVVNAGPQTVVLEVTAAADAALGARDVTVGKATATASLVVFDKVDRVAVEPAATYARVGDADGPIAPETAQFEAVGFMNGADGKAGTDDDVRIGVFAAKWSFDDFDEGAAAMNDKKFVGSITPTGMFMPAGAGPNPSRTMSTNNVGNLSVTAMVDDNGKAVEGKGQLFVTVQRFVDPPIR
ncbi:MAG: quinohemoprotein amine dehydrogenase subunit alpha [Hyphomicrobiales bacterium]